MIRTIWETDNPRQRLLDSLLLDFSTRGSYNNKFLAGFWFADKLQINAIWRMLYYFPNQTSELVADRIDRLDVSDKPYLKRCAKNGISALNLVAALSWCKLPQVRQALKRLGNRAKDSDIIEALKQQGIDVTSN